MVTEVIAWTCIDETFPLAFNWLSRPWSAAFVKGLISGCHTICTFQPDGWVGFQFSHADFEIG